MSFPLDPNQEQAANWPGNALISACPGSGKTALLSARASRLLSKGSGRLAAVTFTRDAADELKRRISALCPENPGRRLITGTFHSLALAQFRSVKAKVRVLGAGEQYSLLRRVWEATPEIQDLSFDEAVSQLETLKSSMDPPPGPDKPMGIFYRAYQDSLGRLGVYDFADLILQSVHGMRNGDLPPLPVRHMLVDEAQDMDSAQYSWIQCHAKAGAEITIVGDDDQSIYQWRNALGYHGMMRFCKEFDAKHLNLSTNYRSAPEIIQVATDLIARNKERVEKGIRAHRWNTGRTELVSAVDRSDEAKYVVGAIKEDPDAKWGILSRTNRLLDEVELALCKAQIPCKRVGGGSFWESLGPSIFFGLLRSLAKGDSTGEMLALGWAGIPQAGLEKVGPVSSWNETSAKLKSLLDDAILDKAAQRLLTNFLKLRAQWSEALHLDRIRLVISGVASWCKSQERQMQSKRGQGKETSTRDHSSIFSGCEEALSKLSGSIEQRIRYLTSFSGDKSEGEIAKVVLMTIHNSKGLQWPNVWVIGAEEGVLPISEEAVEEERRLAYVAITRAEDRLVMSYVKGVETGKPSRFLSEAGLMRRH